MFGGRCTLQDLKAFKKGFKIDIKELSDEQVVSGAPGAPGAPGAVASVAFSGGPGSPGLAIWIRGLTCLALTLPW